MKMCGWNSSNEKKNLCFNAMNLQQAEKAQETLERIKFIKLLLFENRKKERLM